MIWGSFKLRLKALEEKVAREGIILTESQVRALERKKLDDEASGEIDTDTPWLPWFHRTLSMLEPLKVLAVFISRRMLILTPR